MTPEKSLSHLSQKEKRKREPEIEQVSTTSPFLTQKETSDAKLENPMTIDAIEHIAASQGGFVLYHGGLEHDSTLDTIDLDRTGTQQNKPGRTYGGFYLTDNTSRPWAEEYARKRNGNLHGFLIDQNARIFRTEENIDRLSQEDRAIFATKYDLIQGKDLVGRIQYVLLNKNVVKKIAHSPTNIDGGLSAGD